MLHPIIGKEYPNVVIPLINSAEATIEIIVYDWRWYSEDVSCVTQLFNHSIVQAVRRGVKVRAICNSQKVCKILKENGLDVKSLLTEHLVHAKMIIIDDKVVVLGSHNYTQAAFTLNYEISVLAYDPECALSLKQYFNNLFQQNV
jgi:phosphatidylserine/phosphatidylglycerophosphate/cardiolipin synthase-like enzyme